MLEFSSGLAMFTSGADMMIIVVVVLILFGGQKVPELMRGLGKGLGELQKGLDDAKQVMYQASQEVQSTATAASNALNTNPVTTSAPVPASTPAPTVATTPSEPASSTPSEGV